MFTRSLARSFGRHLHLSVEGLLRLVVGLLRASQPQVAIYIGHSALCDSLYLYDSPFVSLSISSYLQGSTFRIPILVFHSRYSRAAQASKSESLAVDSSTTGELRCEAR